MAARISEQLAAAADLLRPRTFFRTLARVDEVNDKTRALEATVEALRLRTEKLETIARLDWELQNEVARLPQILDPARIEPHVRAAVASATLVEDPFPHIVVERWLPADVYRVIVRALPPAVFFIEKELSRQRLLVPFSFAPTYSRRVWTLGSTDRSGRCRVVTVRRSESCRRSRTNQSSSSSTSRRAASIRSRSGRFARSYERPRPAARPSCCRRMCFPKCSELPIVSRSCARAGW